MFSMDNMDAKKGLFLQYRKLIKENHWCPIKVFQEQYQSQRDCLVVAGFSHVVDKPGNVLHRDSF